MWNRGISSEPTFFEEHHLSHNSSFVCHNLSLVQVKAEFKIHDLCLLQRSAKVRFSALLAISDFLPPSQNIKKYLS